VPFEDLSLQSLVGPPREAPGEFCPECGQSLTLRVQPSRVAAQRSWWSFVLLIAGAYLIVRYGPPSWIWYRELAHGADLVRAFDVDPRHVPTTFGWGPNMALTTYAVAQDQLLSKLTGVVVGLFALIAAIDGWVGRYASRAAGRHGLVSGAFVELHRSATSAVLAGLGLLFLGYAYLLVAQLIGGTALSFDLADQTATQVVDVVAALVRTIVTGSSIPGYDGAA
jgi:hypothetical protein